MKRITLFAIAFTACATVGKKFDTSHVHEIQKGKQTKAEITAWFGPAHSTTQLTKSELGCVERWQWTHARSSMGSTTAEALLVDFDSDGKVCDNAYSKQ